MILPSAIKYNCQRNNLRVGSISGSIQCGYTTCAMLLSSVATVAETDEFVAKMVEDMEINIGKPGWGEKLLSRAGWAGGWIFSQVKAGKARMGAYMDVYVEYVKDFLLEEKIKNVKVEAVLKNGSWDRVKLLLKTNCPVMLGTRILPSGHFILLVDYDVANKAFKVKDPWGNPLTGYKDKNGDGIWIPEEWLISRCQDGNGKKGLCRYIALIQEGI
jgi:hypothetical protein